MPADSQFMYESLLMSEGSTTSHGVMTVGEIATVWIKGNCLKGRD